MYFILILLFVQSECNIIFFFFGTQVIRLYLFVCLFMLVRIYNNKNIMNSLKLSHELTNYCFVFRICSCPGGYPRRHFLVQ